MFTREQTKQVKVGNLTLGGNNKVYVQSMLNAPANDFNANIKQAVELEKAGCEIIRVSVPNTDTVKLIYKLKEAVNIPVVADIHFDYKLAVLSAEAGVDKIRINPGNIGSIDGIKQVLKICNSKNIPIRIGVNSGSIEKEYLEKYGVCARSLFLSAKKHIDIAERYDFDNLVLSLKASNVKIMFDAYKIAATETKYPLHLGVTEAGTEKMGTIKSAAGIGGLLLLGLGNTIRVSLTDNPLKEIEAANNILKAVEIKQSGVKIVSCPTCGRTSINLIALAKEAEEYLNKVDKNITVAIMGCVVNGPGEAREADIGIAGGNKEGLIFKKGKIIKKVPEKDLLKELFKEIDNL